MRKINFQGSSFKVTKLTQPAKLLVRITILVWFPKETSEFYFLGSWRIPSLCSLIVPSMCTKSRLFQSTRLIYEWNRFGIMAKNAAEWFAMHTGLPLDIFGALNLNCKLKPSQDDQWLKTEAWPCSHMTKSRHC